MRQLFDVVYHAIQLPLRINLGSSPEGEAVELFVVPQESLRYPKPGKELRERVIEGK